MKFFLVFRVITATFALCVMATTTTYELRGHFLTHRIHQSANQHHQVFL